MRDEEKQEAPEPGQFFRQAAIFYFLLATAAVFWIGWDRGVIGADLFFDPSTLLIDIGVGIAGGSLLLLATIVGRRLIPSFAGLEVQLARLLTHVTPGEAVALALLSGFAEELFFRGAVQGSWGFLWATILFALMHLGPDRVIGVWSLFALAAGALFGGMTLVRGTILPAIIAHALVNGVNLRRLVGRTGLDAPEASDLVD